MRQQRPPRGGAWAGPHIPQRYLRPFWRIDVRKEFCQEEGGIYKTTEESIQQFHGVLLPLSNEDLERMPEGTGTTNSQKLYTNGFGLEVGQRVRDSLDDQVYTVTNELTHLPIHGMKRYVVTRKGAAANR